MGVGLQAHMCGSVREDWKGNDKNQSDDSWYGSCMLGLMVMVIMLI